MDGCVFLVYSLAKPPVPNPPQPKSGSNMMIRIIIKNIANGPAKKPPEPAVQTDLSSYDISNNSFLVTYKYFYSI